MQLDRGSYHYIPEPRDDRAVTLRMREIAAARPRYGVNRIHVLLRREGWNINHKKTERIYREEKLWVRTKKCRRRKMIAIARVAPEKAEYINQIWTMDFVHDQLFDGRKIRCLTLVDKLSRESLAIDVNYRLKSEDVIQSLNLLKLERPLQKLFVLIMEVSLHRWP